MLVTEDGIVTEVKLVHPRKAFLGIFVHVFGITTLPFEGVIKHVDAWDDWPKSAMPGTMNSSAAEFTTVFDVSVSVCPPLTDEVCTGVCPTERIFTIAVVFHTLVFVVFVRPNT
jgi:hypothetical protein